MQRLTRFLFTIAIVYAIAYVQATPQIVLIATGGTIAGHGVSSVAGQYQPAQTPVEELVKAVPKIHNFAKIRGEQFSQIASQDMTPELWLKLGLRVNELLATDEVDGIVITHGTDTLEETAYFLHLVIKSAKPVVITGSMRPPTSRSADGALNLYNAVAVATNLKSWGKGVLVVLNDEIHGAREVTKRSTTNIAAFESPVFGPLGSVHYGKVHFYRLSSRKHTVNSEFSLPQNGILPRVDIYYSYAGFLPSIIQVDANFVKGIVFVGTGNGNPNQKTIARLAQASKSGIAVVRSSRPGTGRVTLHAEVDDKKYGFVVADNLNPQKSRILLMLALLKATDPQTIQKCFFEY